MRLRHGWGTRAFAVGVDAVEGDEEGMDGEGHPEADDDVRDEEAGVEEGADAGGEGEGGVESAAVGVSGGRDGTEEAEAEGVGGEQKGEGEESEGKAGGPVVGPEEVHGAGGEPVHEGRLVEETDAVDIRGDVVVAQEHLAGDLDVDGVDVVEQAGGKETADVQDEPCEDNHRDGARAPTGGRGRGEPIC
jgi:hypothetical protein